MSRIEEQERQLLQSYSNNFDINAAQEGFKDWVKVDTNKKKKRKAAAAAAAPIELAVTSPDTEKLATLLDQNDYVVKYKSRKKKRRHRAIDEDLATSLSKCLSTTQSDDNLHGILDASSVIKKKNTKKVEKKKNGKKKRKHKEDIGIILDEDVEITEVDGIAPEAQKYLKRPKHSSAIAGVISRDEVDSVKVKQTKKCKRKRKETKAVDSERSGNDCTKVSKREKSKLIKNNRKIEKIARQLQDVMSIQSEGTDVVEQPKKKKKKNKK